MRRSKLLAYAQLLRIPNVFTAFADIALGAFAAGYLTDRPGDFLLLLLASGCLYTAGMAWNDYFDRHEDARARPFRPIPSGRVSPGAAVATGLLLLAAGLGLAAATTAALASNRFFTPAGVALLLSGAILLYDAGLKRTLLGPLGMGTCRFLNVMLGLSGGGGELVTLPHLHLAGVIGVYIVGVTWFARTEESESRRTHLGLAAGVMLLAALAGLMLPVHFSNKTAPWYFPYLLTGFLFFVGLPVVRAIRRPDPKHVQTAVKRSIFGLVVLDAVLAVAFVGWPGLLILLLLPPALRLGKWVYST